MNEIQTRFNEKRFFAQTGAEMVGCYAVDNVFRVWKEAFLNEETGETIEIERKERLFDRGTLFSEKNVDSVEFYLQSGEIDGIEVSNQKRLARSVEKYCIAPYKVKTDDEPIDLDIEEAATVPDNGLTVPDNGLTVPEDDENVPELELNNDDDPENDDTDENTEPLTEVKCGYYKITIALMLATYNVDKETGERRDAHHHSGIGSYLVNAKNADEAKAVALQFIMMTRAENVEIEEAVTMAAKPLNCTKVIEREFTMQYVNQSDENA